MVASIEDLKNYKNMDKVHFICETCKKDTTILKVNFIRKKPIVFLCSACKRKKAMKEKFGAETTFARKDLKRWSTNPEKGKQTKIERYGSLEEAYRQVQEKMQRTKLERYGSKTYNNRDGAKKTCLDNYGVENPQQREEIKEKTAQTNLKRYGVKYLAQNKQIMQKQLQTKIERYGENYELAFEKIKQTKLERYGNEYYTNREKAEQTCLERYGSKFTQQSSELKEKSKKSFNEHFPDGSIEKQDIYRRMNEKKLKNHQGHYLDWNKYRKTMKERYGYEHPSQSPEIHKRMVSHIGKTKPEKKFEEMLKQRGFEYQSEYFFNQHHYDFAVFENDNLKVLIDIDGLYFHALTLDADGKHSRNSEKDLTRHFVNNIPVLIIDEYKLEDGFRELLRIFNISYDNWIDEIYQYCLSLDFPYPSYEEKRLLYDYKRLCKYTFNSSQHLGESLVYQFHKSIWSYTLKGKPSPVQAWKDKDLLLKCIKNRFIYASKLSSQQIVRGFTINKLAPRISIFNPSYAKYLIEKYLNYSTVFDPFSGFSGRLLGAASLGKYYIGQDINSKTVFESNQLKQFLNLDASIIEKDIFNSSGEYECLFTCPPYNDKENWGQKIANLSCDDWVQECLNRFKCENYLFVVDKTEKFEKNIVEIKQNKSHIGSNNELVLLF